MDITMMSDMEYLNILPDMDPRMDMDDMSFFKGSFANN
jgi:hypothetical protein